MARVPKWQLTLHLVQRDNREPLGTPSEFMKIEFALPVADRLKYNYPLDSRDSPC